MVIKEKLGALAVEPPALQNIDWLDLEWFETQKRIQHKKTRSGLDLSLKFLKQSPELTQGDILFQSDSACIAVNILPCDSLVVCPSTIFETASLCYEIGNKHLPLFFDENALLIPFDAPLFRLLQAQGYPVVRQDRRLLFPLKTTVSPHGDSGSTSLFTKILNLTNS